MKKLLLTFIISFSSLTSNVLACGEIEEFEDNTNVETIAKSPIPTYYYYEFTVIHKDDSMGLYGEYKVMNKYHEIIEFDGGIIKEGITVKTGENIWLIFDEFDNLISVTKDKWNTKSFG